MPPFTLIETSRQQKQKAERLLCAFAFGSQKELTSIS
jgi:hypothetical protein